MKENCFLYAGAIVSTCYFYNYIAYYHAQAEDSYVHENRMSSVPLFLRKETDVVMATT